MRDLVLRLSVYVTNGFLDDTEFLDDLLHIPTLDELIKKMHFLVDFDHFDGREEAKHDGDG